MTGVSASACGSAVKAVNSVINPILVEEKILSGTEPEPTIKSVAENHPSAFTTIQQDLFSVLLTGEIKLLVYLYCFVLTPATRSSQRDKRHT